MNVVFRYGHMLAIEKALGSDDPKGFFVYRIKAKILPRREGFFYFFF